MSQQATSILRYLTRFLGDVCDVTVACVRWLLRHGIVYDSVLVVSWCMASVYFVEIVHAFVVSFVVRSVRGGEASMMSIA